MKYLLPLLISTFCLAQSDYWMHFPHIPNTNGVVQSSIKVYNDGNSQQRFSFSFQLADGTGVTETHRVDPRAWLVIPPEEIPPGTHAIILTHAPEQLHVRLEYTADNLIDVVSIAPVKRHNWHRFQLPSKREGWLAAALYKPGYEEPGMTAELISADNTVLAQNTLTDLFTNGEKGTVDLTTWLQDYPEAVYVDFSSSGLVAVNLLNGGQCGNVGWNWKNIEPLARSERFFKLELRGDLDNDISSFTVELDEDRLIHIHNGQIGIRYLGQEQIDSFFSFLRSKGALTMNIEDHSSIPNCDPAWWLTVDASDGFDRNQFSTDGCILEEHMFDLVDATVDLIQSVFDEAVSITGNTHQ